MQCGHQGAQNHKTTSEFAKSISSGASGPPATSVNTISVVSTSVTGTSVVVVVGAAVVVVVSGTVVGGSVVGASVVEGSVVGGSVVGVSVVVVACVVVVEATVISAGSLDVSTAPVDPPQAANSIARTAITERVNFATQQECHIEQINGNTEPSPRGETLRQLLHCPFEWSGIAGCRSDDQCTFDCGHRIERRNLRLRCIHTGVLGNLREAVGPTHHTLSDFRATVVIRKRQGHDHARTTAVVVVVGQPNGDSTGPVGGVTIFENRCECRLVALNLPLNDGVDHVVFAAREPVVKTGALKANGITETTNVGAFVAVPRKHCGQRVEKLFVLHGCFSGHELPFPTSYLLQ